MKIVALLLLPAFTACLPIGGADPLDSAGSALPVIRTAPDEETGSSFRGEIGVKASADF